MSSNYINPFTKNRTRNANGKFGHAERPNNSYESHNNEDSVISNILHAIHKSPFMKKVLYNAIGLTLMAASTGFASDIQRIGTNTTVTKDGSIYKIETAADQIKNSNAFNAFKAFQLSSGDIANFYFHKDNVKNIVNFVKGQVNVQGIINTIKSTDGTAANSTGKVGGNLYFLSSNGVVIGSTGVINTGSFYAIVPNEAFMKRFLNNYENDETISLNIENLTNGTENSQDVNYILSKAIVGYKGATEGITLNPDGKITVGGKINARNDIGLYAGGNIAETAGIEIQDGAKLQTLTKDAFASIVNTTNNGNQDYKFDEVDFEESNNGGISLVAIGGSDAKSNITLGDAGEFSSRTNIDIYSKGDGEKTQITVNSYLDVVDTGKVSFETNGDIALEKKDALKGGTAYDSSTINNLSAKARKIFADIASDDGLEITATNDINIEANIEVKKGVNDNNLKVDAGGNLKISSTANSVTAKNITLDSVSSDISSRINSSGTLTATGDEIVLSGTVNSTGNVSITATADVSVSDLTSTNGTLTIIADTVSALTAEAKQATITTQNGAVIDSIKVTDTAAGDVYELDIINTVSGDVQITKAEMSGNSKDLRVVNNNVASGSIKIGKAKLTNIFLDAGKDVTVTTSIETINSGNNPNETVAAKQNPLYISAGGDISIEEAKTARELILNGSAEGDVILNNADSADEILISVPNGDFDSDGLLKSGNSGNIEITASGEIGLNEVESAADFVAGAGTDVSSYEGGKITAAKKTYIDATGEIAICDIESEQAELVANNGISVDNITTTALYADPSKYEVSIINNNSNNIIISGSINANEGAADSGKGKGDIKIINDATTSSNTEDTDDFGSISQTGENYIIKGTNVYLKAKKDVSIANKVIAISASENAIEDPNVSPLYIESGNNATVKNAESAFEATIIAKDTITSAGTLKTGDKLALSAKNISIGELDVNSLKVESKTGINIGNITTKKIGEGYEIELINTEKGNITTGNISANEYVDSETTNIGAGDVKIINSATAVYGEETTFGNVTIGGLTSKTVSLGATNDLVINTANIGSALSISKTQGAIASNNEIKATSVTLSTPDAISLKNITATDGDVNIATTNNAVAITGTVSGETAQITSKTGAAIGSVITNSTDDTGYAIRITNTDSGNLTITGSINAKEGDNNGKHDVRIENTATVANESEETYGNVIFSNSEAVSYVKNVYIKAAKDVTIAGTVNSTGISNNTREGETPLAPLTLNAVNGKVSANAIEAINSTITGNGDITITTANITDTLTATSDTSDVKATNVTTKDANLKASNDIALTTITATGNLTALASNTVDLGTVNASGTMKLTADNVKAKVASATANVADIKGYTVELGYLATTGNMTVESTNSAISIATANAGNNADITAKTNLTVTDKLAANADLTITATEGKVNANELKAGNLLTINALTVNKVASATAGVANITSTNNAEITRITTTGNTVITSNNGTVTAGTVEAANATITGNGDVSVTAAYIASDTVITSNIGSVTADTIEAANADLIINATTGNVEAESLEAGNNLTITATEGNVNANELQAGNLLTINALTVDKVASATAAVANITSTNNAEITKITTTGNTAITSNTGTVTAGTVKADNATITGNGDINVTTADITSGINVTSSNGAVTAGTIEAGTATIQAKEAVSITTKVATTGDTAITSNNSTITANLIEADNANLTAKNNISLTTATIGNTLTATSKDSNVTATAVSTKDADIKAANNIDITSITATGNMTANASGTANIGTTNITGNANITTQDSITGSTLNVTGNLTALASNTVDLGTVNASGTMKLTADNVKAKVATATVNVADIKGYKVEIGNIATTGDMTVKSTNGAVAIATANIGDNANITTKTSLTVTDKLAANSNLTITATTGNVEAENLEAGNNLTITATAGNVNANELQAGNLLTINALTVNKVASATAGVANITSTNNAEITKITTTGNTAITSDTGTVTAGTVEAANATITGNDDVSVTAAYIASDTAITSNIGSVTADTIEAANANIIASGTVAITNKVATTGDTTITSNNGTVTANTVEANNATVNANGDINITTADIVGNIAATSENESITVGTIEADNANLNAKSDISLTAATIGDTLTATSNDSNITATTIATKDAEIKAANNIDITSITATGNMTANASGTANIITANIAGNANITTQNNIIGTTLNVTGNLTALASNTIDLDAVEAGNATITGDDDVNITTADIGNDIAVTSTNGAVTSDTIEATTASIQANEDVSITTKLETTGDSTITSETQKVTAENIKSDNVTINAYAGTKINELETAKNADLTSFEGKLEVTDSVIGGDMTVESTDGTIILDKVTAPNGALDVYSKNGNIEIITAEADKIWFDAGGYVEILDKATSNEAELLFDRDAYIANLNINGEAEILCTEGVLTVYNLTAEKALILTNSDINITTMNIDEDIEMYAENGAIKTEDLTAKKLMLTAKNDIEITSANINDNIDVKSDEGSVKIEDIQAKELAVNSKKEIELKSITTSNGIKVTSQTGDITGTTIKTKDATLEAAGDIQITSINGINPAVNPNLLSDLRQDLNEPMAENAVLIAGGNIDMDSISAENTNVTTINGDINIETINANDLNFAQQTQGTSLNVKTANVAQTMFASSSDIKIDSILHLNDDKPIEITFPGVNGQKMNNVVIKNIDSTVATRINGLVSEYADIHVNHKDFKLTGVYVANNGDLSNLDTKLKIYGKEPRQDRAYDYIIYFFPNVLRKTIDIDFMNLGNSSDYDLNRNIYNVGSILADMEFKNRIKMGKYIITESGYDLNKIHNWKLRYKNIENDFRFGDIPIMTEFE